jgi:hypothetical protein
MLNLYPFVDGAIGRFRVGGDEMAAGDGEEATAGSTLAQSSGDTLPCL